MLKRPAPSIIALLASFALLALAAGCSGRPAPFEPGSAANETGTSAAIEPGQTLAAPPPGAHRGYFPLELGNRWGHVGRLVEKLEPRDGEPSRAVHRYQVRTKLVCRERIGDRGYVVAREVMRVGDDRFKQWIRYRQDRDGLYEADVPTNVRPECEPARDLEAIEEEDALDGADFGDRDATMAGQRAFEDPAWQAAYDRAVARAHARLEQARRLAGSAGDASLADGSMHATEGLARGEIRRLDYPLRAGARWRISGDPRFVAHVLGNEQLHLPAGRFHGWKTRIRSELFGPDDRVLFWVSRDGFLKYDIRVVADMTDETGAVLGRVVIHDVRELSRIDLGGPGRKADPHSEPAAAGLDP